MTRIESIKAYRTQQDNAKTKQAEEQEKAKVLLTEKIRTLQPRISELIDTANACLENGIEIDTYGKGFYYDMDSYDKGTFVTNGITHRVGFVRSWSLWNTPDKQRRIKEIGIDNGGACGKWNFRTDGIKVYSVMDDNILMTAEPRNADMKRFINEFDTFEKAFYEYVDKIINGNAARTITIYEVEII